MPVNSQQPQPQPQDRGDYEPMHVGGTIFGAAPTLEGYADSCDSLWQTTGGFDAPSRVVSFRHELRSATRAASFGGAAHEPLWPAIVVWWVRVADFETVCVL